MTRAGRKATRARLGLVGSSVDPTPCDGAARPFRDQPSRSVGAQAGQSELLALLEAEARLRAEAVALAGPADADRVEDRRLDDDVRSSWRLTSEVRAAHDPGDAERAARVGDDQRLGVELAIDVVEGLEPLAGLRPPDHDRAPATGFRRPPAASKVWIGLPSSSMT